MGRSWLSILLAASIVALTGCDLEELAGSARFKEDFHQTHPLKAGGRLYVENFNGSVEVTGWDQETADISGTKYAASEQGLSALKIDVVAGPDSVRIRTVKPSDFRGSMGAKYVIKVPRKVLLERVESSNGSIRVQDIDGTARLRTSNAGLNVSRLSGALEGTTSNGGVELSEIGGPVVVRSSNGGIKAESVRGALEATTSNAGIHARLASVEKGRPVKLTSSNGGIELVMDKVEGNEIEATTSNASITARLPGSLAAQVKAHTSNASVSSDFEVTMKGSLGKNQLEGTIGGGGPALTLTTSNGHIRIEQIR